MVRLAIRHRAGENSERTEFGVAVVVAGVAMVVRAFRGHGGQGA